MLRTVLCFMWSGRRAMAFAGSPFTRHWGLGYDRIVEELGVCAGRPLGKTEQRANRNLFDLLRNNFRDGEIVMPCNIGAKTFTTTEEMDKFMFWLDRHQISTADTLYRHLISHNWNLRSALKQLERWCQWRVAFRVQSILDEEFPDEVLDGFVSGLYGRDPIGFPIFFEKVLPDKSGPVVRRYPEEALRFQLWGIEWGRWQAIERLNRTAWTEAQLNAMKLRGGGSAVIDVSAMSWTTLANRPLMKFYEDLQAILNEKVPESVALLMYINCPWYFGAMWACFKPFVSEWIAKKIRIVRVPNTLKELDEEFGLDNVPAEFGGRGARGPFRSVAEEHRRYHAARRQGRPPPVACTEAAEA